MKVSKGPQGALEIRQDNAIDILQAPLGDHVCSHAGAALKVTNVAAFAQLMQDMQLAAHRQRQVDHPSWPTVTHRNCTLEADEAAEQQRALQEGSAYKPKAEREQAAKDAKQRQQMQGTGITSHTCKFWANWPWQEGQEARVVGQKFDPYKDYYKVLGLAMGASAAQLKAAYKQRALLLHPDKQRGATLDEAAAVSRMFRDVVEAYDVLADEEQRSAYDHVRTYMRRHPGAGLPPLTPEQAALMKKGLLELAQLRRRGVKTKKHPPAEVELHLSLGKLNSGCIRTLTRLSRCVDGCGMAVERTTTHHVVVRRGAQQGQRHILEGEGDESLETLAGDLLVVLQQKPHAHFRRSGIKDLEMISRQQLQAGDTCFAEWVTSIYGQKHLVVGSALVASLTQGGLGGLWQTVLTGEGLYDPEDPWDQPRGDLVVKVRFPPVILKSVPSMHRKSGVPPECDIDECQQAAAKRYEDVIAHRHWLLRNTGIWQLLWSKYIGGSAAGWAQLHAAASRAACAGTPSTHTCLGMLHSSCLVLEPLSGEAETLVAPSRDILQVERANGAATHRAPVGKLSYDDDLTHGFYCGVDTTGKD
ncbi:hypothetical protein WJX72_003540 [[Myrmecia] bisecta]|uniref:J domain-containing protein n=1 Tax=[Myrmecia] bisecta TaxID=41462 RepID=A0AAW1Q8V8_9CHLO